MTALPELVVQRSADGSVGWFYRVQLTRSQAIVCFQRKGRLAVGFEVEKQEWDRNQPVSNAARSIVNWIWMNRGPTLYNDKIAKPRCIEAVRLIQAAIEEDRAVREQGTPRTGHT